MPKIKMPKSSPSLDMTPMVDLGFLLVTFFILTSTFRASEPVEITTPSSTSEITLPENMILITVSAEGKAFFTINGTDVRKETLDQMAVEYKQGFSEEQKKRFATMSSFGCSMQNLGKYIDLNDDKRKSISTGIPMDSLNNQLGKWIEFGYANGQRNAKAKLDEAKAQGKDIKVEPVRFAIKADNKAPYIAVKQAIKVLTDLKHYRFNLITSLEGSGDPANAVKE